ncbi:MAG TPA: hypothetical protein VE377_07340 [Candidatus Dormibacteraeota bacterium]|nr:hypothetical protein [Candidatus Dormibacteraeota bacterium]
MCRAERGQLDFRSPVDANILTRGGLRSKMRATTKGEAYLAI